MVAIERKKRRVRLVNPQDAKQTKRVSAGTRAKKRTHRKANPVGEVITLGTLINPQRTPMKKAKKNGRKAKARKPNPVVFIRSGAQRKSNGRRHARRRNPDIIGPAKTMLEQGAFALAGLVATRQLPQLALADKNTGMMGYGANAITAAVVAYLAGKFVGREAANATLIGGGAYLVNRILTEQVSPVGRYLSLSGVGDAAAASGLGRLARGYFPLPVQRDQQGNPIVPQAIVEAVMKQLPAPAAAPVNSKVAGISRRVAPRF